MRLRNIIALCICVAMSVSVSAQRFHCEQDTVTAMRIIREMRQPGAAPAGLCGKIAEQFVGIPYVAIANEDSLGVAEIRFDAFDDFSFINGVAALSKLATSPGNVRPLDVVKGIEELTFRKGKADGFPSRMLYGGDWVVDNRSRNNVKELTEDNSQHFKTKSLEYVGRHPEEYKALKDSATLERQKMVELGYRTFKIPHMKRESSEWKDVSADLREGDLIMLLTSHPEKDIWEMGYLIERPDGLHLIHVSEKDGAVIEEKETLGRYIKRHSKECYGWRWLRII